MDDAGAMDVVSRPGDAPAKKALLRAALRLFVGSGVAETTIRDVAEAAGVSNPAIFKFFEGREGLALALFERCYERLADAVLPAATCPGASFEERLRGVVRATTAFMDADLDAFLFVQEQLRRYWPMVSPALRRRSIVRALSALYAQGRSEGRVARDQDDALLVAATIGVLTQVGRALYFRELAGPAARRAPELERMLGKIAW